LQEQIEIAGFPFVSSNIKAGRQFPVGNRYLIKQYGYSAGIFALTTLRTLIVASPDRSLTFIPEIKAAREAVKALKKVDIMIGLTHIGYIKEAPAHLTSPALAAAKTAIDIIIDGHPRSFFEEAAQVGNTWIVTANEWRKYAGEITVFDRKPVSIDDGGGLGLVRNITGTDITYAAGGNMASAAGGDKFVNGDPGTGNGGSGGWNGKGGSGGSAGGYGTSPTQHGTDGGDGENSTFGEGVFIAYGGGGGGHGRGWTDGNCSGGGGPGYTPVASVDTYGSGGIRSSNSKHSQAGKAGIVIIRFLNTGD
jgi:hypothetical protein